MKVTDVARATIDYRLDTLGIRVWEDSCQLIVKDGGGWSLFGVKWDLPVEIPATLEDVSAAAAADPLPLTAYQYVMAQKSTDLAEVLEKSKYFGEALMEP